MAGNARNRGTSGTRTALCHAAPARPKGASDRPRSGDNFSGAARSKPVGAAFEQRARQFLERRGLGFVAANVTMRGGELDLVMREPDGMLVFVEVRARAGSRYGGAAASIGAYKRKRILLAARHFLAGRGAGESESPCRFDAVVFEGPRLVWLRDAFREDGP